MTISNEELEKMVGTPLQTTGDTKTAESNDAESGNVDSDSDSDSNSDSNLPATIDEIEYIGEEDYKQPGDIIWFTLQDKAFPTRMVNPFIVMKLAKAQNDQDEQRAMAYTYDLIMAMVPKRYRKALEDHLTVAEYEDTDLNKAIERVMQAWAQNRNSSGPLAKKKDSRGQSTPQNAPGTSRVISFKDGLKSVKPLTEEQKKELARIQELEETNN